MERNFFFSLEIENIFTKSIFYENFHRNFIDILEKKYFTHVFILIFLKYENLHRNIGGNIDFSIIVLNYAISIISHFFISGYVYFIMVQSLVCDWIAIIMTESCGNLECEKNHVSIIFFMIVVSNLNIEGNNSITEVTIKKVQDRFSRHVDL